MIEIERKFLVLRRTRALPEGGSIIEQGYLTSSEPTVRVRIMDERGYLNIKTPRLPSGTKLEGIAALVARAEYEYSIPAHDAGELMKLCVWRLLKTRYELDGGFELDVFGGTLSGLEILEYESDDIDAMPHIPEWLEVREVTGNPLFNNIRLAMEGIPSALADGRIGKVALGD